MKQCLILLAMALGAGLASYAEPGPWPQPVAGFVAPAAGEHPRLYFRKADVPALRAKAQTPEGQAIVARLRFLLNGSDGRTLPEFYNSAKAGYAGNRPMRRPELGVPATPGPMPRDLPVGRSYTLWHGAGYGLLYQLTGEQLYADLGRKAVELALEGQRDRDDRYSFRNPPGFIRAGASIAAIALAYDLCYDGWDDAFRRMVALEIQDYNGGHIVKDNRGDMTLEQLAINPPMKPESNHWGMQIGGTGISVLAILGDPGTDAAKMERMLKGVHANTARAFTGWGKTGYFFEHQGPGYLAADGTFIPMLQAMRIAGGMDYASTREVRFLTLRWVYELLDRNDKPFLPNRHPSSYGTIFFERAGMVDRCGQFGQGFGILPRDEQAALLWVYRTYVESVEAKSHARYLGPATGGLWDASEYPQHAVMAFINWLVGLEPANPATVLPHTVGDDSPMGYYLFRSRWQDNNDTLVTVLLGARSQKKYGGGEPVVVWSGAKRYLFHNVPKVKADVFETAADGSAVLSAGGTHLAVDFSGVAGCEALLVMVNPQPYRDEPQVIGEGDDRIGVRNDGVQLTAGTTTFHVLALPAGQAPEPRVEGETIVIGKQTVRFDGTRLVLGTFTPVR